MRNSTWPAGQANRPVTSETNAGGGEARGDRAAFPDRPAHPLLESEDEVGARRQDLGQPAEADIAAILDIGPAGLPQHDHRGIGVMHVARGQDPLFGNVPRPLQHGVHFGRPAVLPILSPRVSRQRQRDQAGIDQGKASERLAQPLDPDPIRLQHSHPGFHHLLDRWMLQRVGQRMAGQGSPHRLLQRSVLLDGPHQSSQNPALDHLVGNQHPHQSRSGQDPPPRLIGIGIKDRLNRDPLQRLQHHGDQCDRLCLANPLFLGSHVRHYTGVPEDSPLISLTLRGKLNRVQLAQGGKS